MKNSKDRQAGTMEKSRPDAEKCSPDCYVLREFLTSAFSFSSIFAPAQPLAFGRLLPLPPHSLFLIPRSAVVLRRDGKTIRNDGRRASLFHVENFSALVGYGLCSFARNFFDEKNQNDLQTRRRSEKLRSRLSHGETKNLTRILPPRSCSRCTRAPINNISRLKKEVQSWS